MSQGTPRQAAEAILRRLRRTGHQAYLAGGCVRDILMGTEPKDYDIATSATPQEICRIYPRAQQVGAHFGVVIVRHSGHQVEVATFRTDGPYRDGRHPETVTFSTARADSKRRDFTINGMFYDPESEQVIDYVGGQADLQRKLIHAIGNPEQRFEEDHLRMLRAVRFACCLGFEIEQETFEAVYNRAAKIKSISPERIREELEKILCDPSRSAGFRLLCECGLLPHLWPDPSWSTEQIERSRRALGALPPQASFPLALTTMLCNGSVSEIKRVCQALRCSNHVRRVAVWQRECLSALSAGQVHTLADLKLLMAGPAFGELLCLFRAQLSADGNSLQPAESIAERAHAIPEQEVAPPPLVTGEDLLNLGLHEGPIFKRILDELYYRQLNRELVDRTVALEVAKELAGRN